MEQRTGFLSFDGRRIAYAMVGDGPLLVMPAWWVSHVTEDWSDPACRRFLAPLAQRYTVLRYDRLGTGLSDRERPPETFTLEHEVAQLEALVDHVEAGRLSLFGISAGASSSALYAARHPDRVERVVLYGMCAYGGALGTAESRNAVSALVRSAWGLGGMALVEMFAPSMSPEDRRALVAYQRAVASPTMAADLLELFYASDIRDALPLVRAPALVVHREGDRAVPVRYGRELAALIPGAGFVSVAGDAHFPWHGATDGVVDAVSDFLGIDMPRRPAAGNGVEELSPREREVLRLVAEGLSDADIAERLVLSQHTVHRHVANIRRKLGLRSRSAAAAVAARAGLI